jgi:hypothetical protein
VIKAQQLAARVEHDTDCVEAHCLRERPLAASVAHPRDGCTPQPRALTWAQSDERTLAAGERVPTRRAASRALHLGEHQRGSVEGDQVDLAPARANVAPEHREAQAFEVAGGDLLAESADRAPRIGIAGAPGWRGGV